MSIYYSGNWNNLEEIQGDIIDGYVSIESDLLTAESCLEWLRYGIEHNWDVDSKFMWVADTLQSLINAVWHTGIFNWSYDPPAAIPYYCFNYTGAVTMDAIINAMMKAIAPQVQDFIGIEDAFRTSLWNKWFNAEYYAGLVRKFY